MDYEGIKKKLLENIKLENDCWVWQKSCFWDGYGQFNFNKIKYRAHRISYHVFNNEDPKDLYVCHTCDNRKCINPSHLWIGTAKENTKDSINKNRSVLVKGEKCSKSRLTNEQVAEIRKLCKKEVLQKDIAKLYNTTQSNISSISRGESWQNLEIYPFEIGVLRKGIKHRCAKITEKEVKEIRKRRLEGELLTDIAKDYDIHSTTVSSICKYRTWKHIE